MALLKVKRASLVKKGLADSFTFINPDQIVSADYLPNEDISKLCMSNGNEILIAGNLLGFMLSDEPKVVKKKDKKV